MFLFTKDACPAWSPFKPQPFIMFWLFSSLISLMPEKTTLSQKNNLHINNKLNVVETFKYLGVTVDSRLNWEPHISQLIERVSPKIAPEIALLTLYNRRRFLRFVFIFKIVNNQNCPKQLEGYLTSGAELQNGSLWNQGTLDVPQSKTSSGRKTFQIAGASDWNSRPTELRKTTSIGSFQFNLFKLRDSDLFSNHKCTV